MAGGLGEGTLAGEDTSPDRLRGALGRFATGVTVVTTVQGPAGQERPHGMTVSSFTSVSLSPPLVLVSIAKTARMNRLLGDAGRYGVSVLAAEQDLLSLHFSGTAPRPDLVEFVWHRGTPLLAGALAHLTCSVEASYPAGDHTLHIGRVDSLSSRAGDPLVVYTGSTGAFRRLGTER